MPGNGELPADSSSDERSPLFLTLMPGLAALLAGFFYYSIFRGDASVLPPWLVLNAGGINFDHALLNALANAIPSFCYAFAMAWFVIIASIRSGANWRWLVAGHLAFAIILECLTGTTSWFDVAAIVIATTFATWIGSRTVLRGGAVSTDLSATVRHPVRNSWYVAVSMLLLSTVLTVGSQPQEDTYRARYMSYDELRRSVQVSRARQLAEVQRVYIYGDYLFLNERNAGLHVIDNTNPEDPQTIHFIEIPGNTEVSIKQGFLYADSYVDLVTLDIRNINSISEVSRQEDIFPFDAYQNVPSDIYLGPVDPERGVVIGYGRRI